MGKFERGINDDQLKSDDFLISQIQLQERRYKMLELKTDDTELGSAPKLFDNNHISANNFPPRPDSKLKRQISSPNKLKQQSSGHDVYSMHDLYHKSDAITKDYYNIDILSPPKHFSPLNKKSLGNHEN